MLETNETVEKNGKHSRPSHEHPKVKILALTIIVLLSTSFGFIGGWLGANGQRQGINGSVEQGRQLAEDQSTLISDLAQKVGPSVVSVDVTSNRTEVDPFFGTRSSGKVQSAGTGFIISSDGYVLTNRHVVPEGVTKVALTLDDGTTFDDVSVVGRTNSSDPLDIAFLKINDTKDKTLIPVKLGDSSKLEVGDLAIAIGNALGQFQNTVTSGIISGFGRNVEAEGAEETESLQNLIQTDAAINQGNSGGPLINTDGEVIGVNTAVASGDAQNIGFAIPMNDVRALIDSVLQSGKVQRPYLGVRYVQLNEALAKEVKVEQTEGAYIPGEGNAVLSGSPADEAGLKPKDVITKVDDQTLDDSTNSLSSVIGRHKVGDKVTLTIVRNGQEQTAEVTLKQMPADL